MLTHEPWVKTGTNHQLGRLGEATLCPNPVLGALPIAVYPEASAMAL